MSKMFVVGINNMTNDEAKQFINYIRDQKLAWWHWINNFWLLVDAYDTMSCSEIRDKLNLISHGKRNLVLEVSPKTWSGFGPNSANKDMFKWIKNQWR